jgi:hypothetical protein
MGVIVKAQERLAVGVFCVRSDGHFNVTFNRWLLVSRGFANLI